MHRHVGPADGASRRRRAAARPHRPVHWMDVARRAVCGSPGGDRRPASRRGRGRVQHQRRRRHARTGSETIRLLARVFEDDPPDLILLETLSLVRTLDLRRRSRRCSRPASRCGSASAAAATASAASTASTGAAPRATRSGARRAASRRWASAPCWSTASRPTTSTGMLSWLRDFTDLPLGVYPNLGYLSAAGWRHERRGRRRRVRRAGARLARGGRADHRRLLRRRPRARRRGARRARGDARPATAESTPPSAASQDEALAGPRSVRRTGPTPRARRCSRCRSPSIAVEPGVFVPNQASLLVWKYL